MKKRNRIVIGILILFVLASFGCGREEKVSIKKEPTSTSTASVVPTATPEILYKPVVEKGNIYVKKDNDKRQGVYIGKEKTYESSVVTFYLHRVTKQEIWFSFEMNDSTNYYYIHATKKPDKSYEFYDEGCVFVDGELICDGDLDGNIVFKGKKVLLSMWFNNDIEAKSYYELKKKNEENADTTDSVIELSRCLNKPYSKVKQEIALVKPSVFKMGKHQGTDQISYLEIGVKRDAKRDKNLGYFQIKGVGIWCSKEECKKILGVPTEEHTYDLRYRTEDGYEMCFTFYKDHVEKMGIYLGGKKEALEKE